MPAGGTVRRRLLGLSLVVIATVVAATSVAIYTRAFDSEVMIELVVDDAGNALPPRADVKARGMMVGEVRSTRIVDGRAVVSIALDDSSAAMIPGSVTARILPKTLFGERYVALQIPRGAMAGAAIADGDTITQDAAESAVELDELLDNVLPLLEAVPPEKLSSTLGALAQALDGRGQALGRTIDRLDTVFGSVAAEMPSLRRDLAQFAELADTYSTAAPDLVAALDDLAATGRTVTERRTAIDVLLGSSAATASSTADLLAANADSIVRVAANVREPAELFAASAPDLGCMIAAMTWPAEEAKRIVAAADPYPGIRATIRLVNPRGAYLPNQDEPRFFDDRPVSCLDDVTTPGRFFPQYPGSAPNDGSYQPPSRNPGPATGSATSRPQSSPVPASYAGSEVERSTLAVVYGLGSNLDPHRVPAWTALVGAPAFRGADVTVR